MNIQGQGHLLTLAKGLLHIKFKTYFSQKTTSPIKAKLYKWYP